MAWESCGALGYAFSGVRPSSGAETGKRAAGQRICSAFDDMQLAATEDGRTPLNAYALRERAPAFGKSPLPYLSLDGEFGFQSQIAA